MMSRAIGRPTVFALAVTAVVTAIVPSALAQQGRGGGPPQQGRGGGPPQAAQSPRAAAPIDLTGYWVAIVNEDWRWRMVTPPKGDVASVPVSPEGRKIAESWDPATDGSCLAYGAAGLMRMPTRLHITWENDTTLKIETDAGTQSRRLIFDKATPAPASKSLQGFSLAEWERGAPARGGGGPGGPGGGRGGGPAFGSLKVITTSMSGGWLRKNGVPYSDQTTMTEYFDRFATPGGDQWMVITTAVTDPKYLNQEFVTSTHFRREPDGSKWDPTNCKP